jgi:hypothetical protein
MGYVLRHLQTSPLLLSKSSYSDPLFPFS